jgi:hypothetical protein
MIAYNFRAAGKGAGGKASVGQGKLLSPEESGPPVYRVQLTLGAEQQLLGQLGATLGASFPPALLTAYYTALTTRPFVVLTGPEGAGKAALAAGFAAAMAAPESGQFVTIGSDRWAGRGRQSSYYRGIHERFGVSQFLETLNEAAAPESDGKAYFVLLKGLTVEELCSYLSRLLDVDASGRPRLALPGVPADERPVMPANCFITATLHTPSGAGPLLQEELRPAGQIELTPEHHAALVAPPLPPPPVGLQRLLLAAAGRGRRFAALPRGVALS